MMGSREMQQGYGETMAARNWMKPLMSGRSALKAGLAGAMALSLAACGGGLSETLGYSKESPDEFAIVTKAPLVIPPDFSLRPPQPGAPSPRETSPHGLAQTALLGNNAAVSATQSSGEQALLASAGATNADPNIRAIIDDETRALKQKDEEFLDEVLFWQGNEGPAPRVVDARGEAQRLRENEALGRPVTEGETPDFEDDDDEGGLIDALLDW